MVGRILSVLTGTVLFSAASLAGICPVEKAEYAYKGAPGVTAAFVPHAPVDGLSGRLYIRIAVKDRGWIYWYALEQGNGFSPVSLIAIDDPAKPGWRPPDSDSRQNRPSADQTYYGLTKDLAIQPDAPVPGVKAPALFLIPELAPAIWYDARHDENRLRLPRAFFVYTRCRP
jgi:hypothetical protein